MIIAIPQLVFQSSILPVLQPSTANSWYVVTTNDAAFTDLQKCKSDDERKRTASSLRLTMVPGEPTLFIDRSLTGEQELELASRALKFLSESDWDKPISAASRPDQFSAFRGIVTRRFPSVAKAHEDWEQGLVIYPQVQFRADATIGNDKPKPVEVTVKGFSPGAMEADPSPLMKLMVPKATQVAFSAAFQIRGEDRVVSPSQTTQVTAKITAILARMIEENRKKAKQLWEPLLAQFRAGFDKTEVALSDLPASFRASIARDLNVSESSNQQLKNCRFVVSFGFKAQRADGSHTLIIFSPTSIL